MDNNTTPTGTALESFQQHKCSVWAVALDKAFLVRGAIPESVPGPVTGRIVKTYAFPRNFKFEVDDAYEGSDPG